MNIAKDIVTYINTKTSLVLGQDLFLGFLPQDDSVGVVIAESGGYENETNMLRINLQIVSIAEDYTTAEAKCSMVYNALVYSNGFTITSGYVFNCVPINTPTYIGLNEHQQVIMTCNIALYKEK